MNLFFIPAPLLEKITRIGITCLLFLIIMLVVKRIINAFFASLANKSSLVSYVSRIDTLDSLIKNTASLSLFLIFILMIMKEMGFDIIPLLTGAGIVGLAISFGSQTLIKDMIAGFFIIIENQYNVGDVVKMGDFKGRVYRINLRTTILKDPSDNLIYIPNSEIKEIVVYQKKN